MLKCNREGEPQGTLGTGEQTGTEVPEQKETKGKESNGATDSTLANTAAGEEQQPPADKRKAEAEKESPADKAAPGDDKNGRWKQLSMAMRHRAKHKATEDRRRSRGKEDTTIARI